ncbi:MAG: hypothetical protein HZB43_06655 [candidate division Zixibacteria bacterium]|nr:hypothetical protein [candidate division Zixibacteria bacterium]
MASYGHQTLTTPHTHSGGHVFLKRIEVAGFKSFPDPTEVVFGKGVIGIVGPNGCGKSNLTDAVRWVLGEQRIRVLRGGKMEEVIFGGTPQRPALSAAEVTLVIDNHSGALACEFEEVAITRRLDRAGVSEYRLNRAACRLKDINDLLMDTGMGSHAYSVIQQGMIDAIISENPDERRSLFEEAAGVSKYKWRKRAALRKLEATEHDLIRLTDLKNEVATRARSLARQKGRAERHRQLRDELRTLQIVEAVRSYRALHESRSQVQDKTRKVYEECTTLQAAYDALELEWQSALLTTEQAEKAATEVADRLAAVTHEWHTAETRKVQLTGRQKYLEDERAQLQTRLASLAARLAETTERLQKAEAGKTDAEQQKEAVARRAQEAEAAYRAIAAEAEQAEQALQRLNDDHAAVTQERAQLDSQRAATVERRQGWGKLIEELNARLERLALEHDQKSQEIERLRQSIVGIDQEVATTQSACDELKRTLAALETERLQLESDARSWTERLQEWESARDMLAGMIARGEGLGAAAEAVLSDAARWEGHVRSLSDRLHPQAGWERAVELALADRLGALWCDDPATAHNLTSYLAGAATAVWARALLGRIAIVETQAEARRVFDVLGRRSSVVSRDGFLIETSGALRVDGAGEASAMATGTSSETIVGRAHRLEEFQQRIMAGRESLGAAKARLEELVSQTAQTRRDLEAKSAQLRDRESQQRNLHLTMEGENARAAELTRLRDDLQNDLSGRKAALADDDVHHGRQDNLIRQLEERTARITDERRSASEKVAALEEQVRTHSIAVNDARVHTVEAIARFDAVVTEIQRLGESIEETKEEQTQIQSRVAAAAMEAAQMTDQLAILEKSHAELSAAREQLEAMRTSTRAEAMRHHETSSAIDVKVKEARHRRDDAERARSQADIELSRLDVEIDQSRRRMSETLQIDADETKIEESPLTLEELKSKIADIAGHIEGLGPVNPLALEEYEHEKQRWDFFEKQVGDLRAAKKALTETIAELNITAGKRFMETFETARMNFQEVFTQLFRGGEADVRLTNPEDPLDSPIEIFARPRGKKFIGLRQLSGGERALTALSLLFGLYLVKPSPFCILDEVDAPLDDANCARFRRLVDRFKGRTQFIIVTHNKLTMEAADVLYGVTMEQPGVSRIVSVRLKHEGESASDPALIAEDADEPTVEEIPTPSAPVESNT